MPVDFTLIFEDRPGELARTGQVMGDAGVNICGLAAFTGDGRGIVHVLVDDDDAERATQALRAAKIGVADQREVLVIDVVDRPGTLGELARELAAANVNIDLAYTTSGGGVKIVIATDDLESARQALG